MAIPAVSYVRMSSDRQDASPDQQRQEVQRLAAKHGFRIVREYSDLAVSGDATDKRTGFQNMIADASKGDFKAVLCWDQDRFGRFNSIEAGYWIHPLMRAGVELVTVAQGRIDWNDFTGRLMYQITQEGKHAFLKDLARNSMRGKLEAAKRGEWITPPPYGFRLVDRNLEPHPDEAAAVVRIFELYLEGYSTRGVAEEMTKAGIPSRKGLAWNLNSVYKILTNVACVGTYRFNAHHTAKYAAIRGGSVEERVPRGKAPESDWIVHHDHHPAIVTREMFEAAARRLESQKRRTTPVRNGGGFLLTGIVRCGYCGGSMSGRRHKSTTQYLCQRYVNGGYVSCQPNRVGQQPVVDAVLDAIERQLLEPKNLERLRKEMRRQVAERCDNRNLDRLRKRLEAIDGKLTKAKRRLLECDQDMLKAVQDGIRELQDERRTVQEELSAGDTPAAAQIRRAEAAINRVAETVADLRKSIGSDPMRLRELFREAVERIDLKAVASGEGGHRRWALSSGVIHLRGGIVSNLTTVSARH